MLLSIIIPAYNEEKNLGPLAGSLLKMIERHRLSAEIVLVDDNSRDSTPQICDILAKKHKNIRAIHRKGNRGMGNTLKEGTRAARGEIVVWSMADLADDVNTIPSFVAKIKDGYDMVFGSRYMRGGSSGDLVMTKRIASSGFSRLSRILIGTPVDDITNAFRGFRKKVFESVDLKSGDFAISPEFALKAHIKGFRLCQVPTVYKDRIEGSPNFKMFKMSKRYFSVLLSAVLEKYFSYKA